MLPWGPGLHDLWSGCSITGSCLYLLIPYDFILKYAFSTDSDLNQQMEQQHCILLS